MPGWHAAPLSLFIGLLCVSCSSSQSGSPDSKLEGTHRTISSRSIKVDSTETENAQPRDMHTGTPSVPGEPPAPLRLKAASMFSRKPARRSIDELLLFQPSRYPEGDWNPKDLNFEDVSFAAADGVQLHGWYCPHPKPRAVVLYFHGNGGHLAHRAHLLRRLHRLQLTVFIFDYRGYGRSSGKPTVQGVLRDARAARSELAARADVSESHIVLLGRSLGGAIAVQSAIESAPRGLILESTFSSLKDVARQHYSWLAGLVSADRLNSAVAIPQYYGPLLQSHGTNDRIIPYALGQKLFDAANEPKQFVPLPELGHNDSAPPEYDSILLQFIEGLPPANAL